MRRRVLLLLLLAGCRSHLPGTPPPPPVVGEAFRIEESGGVLEFVYSWPAEAAAIPALDARLRGEMESNRNEARAVAETDRDERLVTKEQFFPHSIRKEWTSLGSTPGLLSLAAEIYWFTGGAHGNQVYDSILWDKSAGRAIEVMDLFTDASAVEEKLELDYCASLDAERAQRRGKTDPGEWDGWDECPPLRDQEAAPVDTDGDGFFDVLRVLLPPYEAGPYTEGSYEIDVKMSPTLLKLLSPRYSAAFVPASAPGGKLCCGGPGAA